MLSLLQSRLPSDIVNAFFLENEAYQMRLDECMTEYDYSILETHPEFDVSDVLQYAAQDGNLTRVKWLAEEKGADIHADQGYALVVASEAGHAPVVQWLMAQGCDPRPQSAWPLRAACKEGHLECVKLLMQCPDIYTRACTNKVPLVIAAINGHCDIVRFLVESDYLVGVDSALLAAGMYGYLDICKVLPPPIPRNVEQLLQRCNHKHITDWIKSLRRV